MSTTSATSDATILEYAPRLRRARRIVRRALALLSIALFAVIAIRLGPAAAKKISMYFWQQQCAGYSLPAGTVVYDPSAGNKGVVAKCWANFYPSSRANATVFLHEMKTQDGSSKLIAVDFFTRNKAAGTLVARTFDLGTPLHPAKESLFAVMGNCFIKPNARIFAGQCDPKNRSHFTIEILEEAKPTVIDGWVGETGYVTFERRD